MRMNKLSSLLFIVLFSVQSFAQPKGYNAVKNVQDFQAAMAKANASLQTIASDFNQVKNLSLLSDKIKSKGKFYFKKEDKVRIEYTAPYTYLLVMNGGQVMVKDEQKTSKINAKGNKAMQSVNRIMIDCMRGTVFANPDFKASVFENAGNYMLALAPITAEMKKMFSRIDVYLDKKSFEVNRLTMAEQGGDFTDMNFTNTQRNTAVNEGLFKVK